VPISTAEIRESRTGGLIGEKAGPLPGGMTELDIPQPVIVDVDRIGDDFDMLRIVTDEIGEDSADKRLHTAADPEGLSHRISAGR